MSGPHTPGPWFQSHRRTRGGMYSTEVYCANGETIATCSWYPCPPDPRDGGIATYREANALLIAAAPDLLTALVPLLAAVDAEIEQRKHGGNDEDWADLQRLSDAGHAAIARATGAA